MPETNARIKVCHDTAANFKTNNPTLLVGEWALETDTKKMKIGDGSTAYNALPYSTAEDSDEWRKPDDWIDIRSGALDNSVYFLVGHSSDYQTYPAFSVQLWIEDSGTYDVYIDGIKHLSSVASETISTLNWQTLALETGFEVTYPSSLITHIVRVTPTNSAKSITRLSITDTLANRDGILWIHFAINNAIRLDIGSINAYQTSMEAITAKEDVIKIATTALGLFAKLTGLKKIPIIDFENKSATLTYIAYNSSPYLKKLYIKNLKQTTAVNQSESFAGTNFEEIVTENSSLFWYNTLFNVDCHKLKKLPQGLFLLPVSSDLNFRKDMTALEDTFFDLTPQTSLTRLRMEGNSSPKNLGVKGVVVSPEAPFDSTTSPQLNVSYTGLSRAALVNLFKSMPYNVGYTVHGTPTIVNGVVSGFSSSNGINTDTNFLSTYTNYEIVVKAKRTSGGGGSGLFAMATGNEGNFRCSLSASKFSFAPYTYSDDVSISETFSSDVWYYLRVQRNGATITISYSTDGENWQGETSKNFEQLTTNSSTIRFGRVSTASSYFNGSIDFNETYIKINGVTWFNGANAVAQRQLSSDVTLIGSPTITNGVVSGFSSSKNLSYVTSMQNNTSIEFITKVNNIPSSPDPQEGILCFNSGITIRCYVNTNGRISFYYKGADSGSKYVSSSTNYTNCFIRGVIDSTGGKLYQSVDGVSWNLEAENPAAPLANMPFTNIVIGYVSNTLVGFSGSIDMNNTYIKINGSNTFHGTDPMTKTCSVVGCTGTADLTADDKAIATGKGWSLTVA